jgi:hypothetical protein
MRVEVGAKNERPNSLPFFAFFFFYGAFFLCVFFFCLKRRRCQEKTLEMEVQKQEPKMRG